ncbi:hypothetical protein K437DRAFT_271727 [Tilletiaria anomala UBC 951]|uniref:snRNA-activating protein complex subunit 3 n=1 Tax=Tilletiaria anomala (strain ATCC 24038 / CBS 436.72 / UBC 951) TaxID=1037660 RepID=A0A066WKV3_TILAU|nr:uncharacterized protein K437DRAFT_271727 [Tilletiaria anomala UBC 951]KDN53208.1 hypothetical protein K437DRAFT_271727 [Tilletiaria anomala UBC 951]
MDEQEHVTVLPELFSLPASASPPFSISQLQQAIQDALNSDHESLADESAAQPEATEQDELQRRISLRRIRQRVSHVHEDGELLRRLRKRWEDWSTTEARQTNQKNQENYRKRKRGGIDGGHQATGPDDGLQEGVFHLVEVNTLLEELDARIPLSFRFASYESPSISWTAKRPATESNAVSLTAISAYAQRVSPSSQNLLHQPTLVSDVISIGPRVKLQLDAQQNSLSEGEGLILDVDIYSRTSVPVARMSRNKSEEQAVLGGIEANSPREGPDDEPAESESTSKAPLSYRRRAQDELDGALTLTQSLEIDSRSSLKLFRDTVMCRWNDLPEESRDSLRGGRAVPSYSNHTANGGCALCIEDVIYCEDVVRGYASTLRSHLAEKRSGCKPEEISISARSLSEMTIDKLPALRTGRPYWLWHCGSCQHIFIVRSVRLRHADTDQAAVLGPRITYLAAGSVIRPGILFRRTGKADNYRGGKCGICDVRFPDLLVFGGERVHAPNSASRETTFGLEGMRENMLVCRVCYEVATGRKEPVVPIPSEQGKKEGKGKRKAQMKEDEIQSDSAAEEEQDHTQVNKWTTVPLLD